MKELAYMRIVARLNARLEARDDQIGRLEAALDDQDGGLDGLKDQLESIENINMGLSDRIHELETRPDRIKNMTRRQFSKIHVLMGEINGLKSSNKDLADKLVLKNELYEDSCDEIVERLERENRLNERIKRITLVNIQQERVT
jgi:chromosome segregation ATPase